MGNQIISFKTDFRILSVPTAHADYKGPWASYNFLKHRRSSWAVTLIFVWCDVGFGRRRPVYCISTNMLQIPGQIEQKRTFPLKKKYLMLYTVQSQLIYRFRYRGCWNHWSFGLSFTSLLAAFHAVNDMACR